MHFKVGLLGLGTVGAGLAEVFLRKNETIAEQIGCPISLAKVLVRDLDKPRLVDLPPSMLTTRPEDILDDPDIHIVVEALGGEEPAYTYIQRAIRNRKHIVTPNKEVIAKHGPDILDLARRYNGDVHYEASVGGGIPLIAAFKQDLVANDIRQIRAIINGTTNYILTRMDTAGLPFDAALREAQELGYAEPDPRNDVDGTDAAYKLAILAALAFQIRAAPEDIYREGITELTPADFAYARAMGYAIKLLAIGRRQGNAVELRVHPTLVPREALLARVEGAFNAVEVEGDLTGKVVFYGRGAGARPTASALLADIIDIAQDVLRRYAEHTPRLLIDPSRRRLAMADVESAYYLRLMAVDEPGVLAFVAQTLADAEVSVASIVQRIATTDGRPAEIVIVTHPTRESHAQRVIERLRASAKLLAVPRPMRVEAE
ncbi:MAG: homoserine dehydrogenase [Chloroflexi bacterium]|nr:homoserine dehydrogenase [Chloroflexota bacterium]